MTLAIQTANGSGLPLDRLMRMTGMQVLQTYGPQAYQLMASMQGSGMIPWQRTDYDIEVTRQVQREIIAKEGDCRCGKIDCWKKELGID
jgi:hypothetical protein